MKMQICVVTSNFCSMLRRQSRPVSGVLLAGAGADKKGSPAPIMVHYAASASVIWPKPCCQAFPPSRQNSLNSD